MNEFEEMRLGELPEHLRKDARAADKVDKGRAEVFTALLRTEGWKVYEELLDKQLQMIADDLLKPSGSIDGVLLSEYQKGTMRGLLLAKQLPSATIAAMTPSPADPDSEIPQDE